jgi:hypothetical protein
MKNIKHDINNKINNLRVPIRNSYMYEQKIHNNIKLNLHNNIIEFLYDIIRTKITSLIVIHM